MSIHKASSRLSMPRVFLHMEGVTLLAAVLLVYGSLGFSWGTFALFLLAPDLPLFFYPFNQRAGSAAYNLAHTTIFPLALGLFSLATGNSPGLQAALIWLAHIGMDRAFGYGFKYTGQMKETHFSRI